MTIFNSASVSRILQLGIGFITLSFASLAFAQGPTVLSSDVSDEAPKASRKEASPQGLGKTVAQIEVEGLKRIEKDAVLAKVGTKTGDLLSAMQVRADIRALFGMGYFDDIAVESEPLEGPGNEHKIRLYYIVRERPVVGEIVFAGNERISSSDLKDVIKIKEWSILDINKVKEDVALLQKHYEEKGFYLAKVSFEVKPTEGDQVLLRYKVSDYEKVQIKKITFLNNKKFTDSELKSVLGETREGGFFSFVTSSGNFKESAFKQDLQRLTYWYLEHGYIKFRYENPVVTISDDKKWLYISIYVEEGEPFKISSVEFSGDLLFPQEELHREVTLAQHETFSISKRNADIQKLTEKYQDLGYAFVNVIPKMNVHEEEHTLDLDYSFEKGSLVYFGEINVVGNSKTYDKVIRRELKIHEGDLFSGTKLRQSKENVERLGFFSPGEVLFNTIQSKKRMDVLDVEIAIKERSTGTITLGAGYGSYQGFFFTTQIAEINLLGRGQNLSLAATYSINQLSQSLNLGFVEPYTFDTLWSTGFDVYATKFYIPGRYFIKRQGFDVRVGHPIMEFTNSYLTYKFEGIQDLYPDPSIPLSVIQADSGLLSSVTATITRDKRNNRFETTSGDYQSASFEAAGLGGDMKFIKWIVNNRYYVRLIGDLVFRNSTELGQISGYGDKPIPPAQKFYLGGPNNMKGYQMFLLGPQTTNSLGQAQPLGGNVEALSLFELEYPLLKDVGIKAVVFFDIGNTWDHFPSGSLSDPFILRSDVGFGFRWFSPIGPLRFEWGYPLAARPTEQSPVFQFFIGPPF